MISWFLENIPSLDNTINIFFRYVILVMFAVYAFFANLFVPRRFRWKKNIQGQRVLITGAGNGVGRELAIEFSKHATCLVLVDINRQWLMETEKLLDSRSSVFIYDCDVSDYKKVYEMASKVKEEVGDVDILVNNAGTTTGKYLQDLPEERVIKTMGVNILAHFWTTKAFLPAMKERNRGHIVSIVSLAGKVGGPKSTDYCASKFAAIGFAESLEIELRNQKLDGVKVTIVCPSHIDTELFKGVKIRGFGSILAPEYVAKEVVLGVREEKEYIFLPRLLRYLPAVKELFPRWLVIRFYEVSGNIKVMDNFIGREPVEASKPMQTIL